jgi:hypothetical protein
MWPSCAASGTLAASVGGTCVDVSGSDAGPGSCALASASDVERYASLTPRKAAYNARVEMARRGRARRPPAVRAVVAHALPARHNQVPERNAPCPRVWALRTNTLAEN